MSSARARETPSTVARSSTLASPTPRTPPNRCSSRALRLGPMPAISCNCPPPTREELGHGAIRATYGRDPEGNLIELQEILDPNHAFYLNV